VLKPRLIPKSVENKAFLVSGSAGILPAAMWVLLLGVETAKRDLASTNGQDARAPGSGRVALVGQDFMMYK
jgi:hypothetical protein